MQAKVNTYPTPAPAGRLPSKVRQRIQTIAEANNGWTSRRVVGLAALASFRLPIVEAAIGPVQ